jgi:ketosteroid isomerase-like protein
MQPSDELRDVILASFEAYSRGDASSVDRYTSRQEGVLVIGSDPDEWIEGAQAAEALKQEAQDDSVKIASPGEVQAFVEGSVGWASSRPTWALEDGREIPTRWTAVFHLEDGEWKAVQAHISVGVPNEELFRE